MKSPNRRAILVLVAAVALAGTTHCGSTRGTIADTGATPDTGGASDALDDSTPPDSGGGGLGTPRASGDVFFMGHSLINHDMPSMLAAIADSRSIRHTFDSHIGSGASLRWIWEHPEGGTGPDPQDALPTGAWNILVFTEAIPLQSQIDYNDTEGFAARYVDLLRSGDPDSDAYLYETWHSLDEGDWRARIGTDRALWERIVDAVNARTDGPDVMLIPGGTALGALVDRVEAGEVPGLRTRRDLFEDHIHLNDLGNYFIACVVVATIYRQSPEGAARQTSNRWGAPFDAPTAEVAAIMQQTAWSVVSADARAGVR